MARRSTFSSPRSFFLAAAVGSVIALAQPRAASACSPMPNVPNVFLAPRALVPTGALSVPKSAGLVFQAQLNTRTEAEAKALVKIEVRSGDTILPGTLTSVGRVVGSYAWWRWVPEGETELPIGALAVKITVTGGSTKDDTVTVEDRTVAPMTPTFTVAAERQLVADSSAPKITCKDESDLGVGSCRSLESRQVSTRALATANMSVALSANDQDKPYFQAIVHMYSRHGGSADAPKDVVGWGTTHAQFEGQLDEFCAQVTTLSLIDGTETETDALCIQNSLDLGTVPASEESAFVKQNLGSCTSADYPPGTNADDPTGRGEGADEGNGGSSNAAESGCTAGAKTPKSNALLVAFTVGLCLLSQRRSRRAV